MQAREAVADLLCRVSTMALATVGPDGEPQVAAVFFAADVAMNLYWVSMPGTRHGAAAVATGRASAAIYPAVWGWAEIRGLQVTGRAEVVTDGSERAEALALYRGRFALPAALSALLATAALYVLRPETLRWLDNSRGFGHKVMLEPAP
jgi:uncharacterized protein YhbP (UPF0306 family)